MFGEGSKKFYICTMNLVYSGIQSVFSPEYIFCYNFATEKSIYFLRCL